MTQVQWDKIVYIQSLIDLERDFKEEKANRGVGVGGYVYRVPHPHPSPAESQ